MSRWTRSHEGPGRAPFVLSGVVHVSAVLLALLTTAFQPEVPQFVTIEVELYEPPSPEAGEPTPMEPEELVVENPLELPPEPAEETPEPVIEEEVPPPPPEPEPVPVEPEPEPENTEEDRIITNPDPDPESEEAGEDINVRIEGVRRDYPEYYENIVRQMDRCFRPPRGSEDRATIYFVILRDGSVDVDGIRITDSSGNFAFDLTAMAAAECAGAQKRFGPLPEDLPFDQLPILFKLDPQRVGGTDLP